MSNKIIIVMIISVVCIMCLISSGGGGYYAYTNGLIPTDIISTVSTTAPTTSTPIITTPIPIATTTTGPTAPVPTAPVPTTITTPASVPTLTTVPVHNPTITTVGTPTVTYLGCYGDTATRAIPNGSGGTFDDCYKSALKNNSQFFGFQYGDATTGIGQCWAGDAKTTLADATKYGTATTCVPITEPITKKKYPNANVGAGFTNAVYQIPITPAKYIGCYADNAARVFSNGGNYTTLTDCANAAKQNGTKYFGFQYGNSTTGIAQCWTGTPTITPTDFQKYGVANTCLPITNTDTLKTYPGSYVGGGWTNAVYQI